MNSTPFFSVIIPVFNVADYINECIDSVLTQTFADFEIILVDDGSSDGSEKICDRYAEENTNISVFHKKNGGQSSARNIGVDLAKGDYFIFLDSDDYIAYHTLEMFKGMIDKNPLLDVILTETMYFIDIDGNIAEDYKKLNIEDYDGISGEQALKNMYSTYPDWSPCGKCYRTEYWRKKGFRFIEGRISEDFQLIDRVILEADTVSMAPVHYYYRSQVGTSTMHGNYEKLVMDSLFVLEDWNEYLERKRLDSELENLIRCSLANFLEHTVMANAYFIDIPERNSAIESIRKCKYMLKYDKRTEGKMINLAVNILGVDKTCRILNLIKKNRKKKLAIL